MPLTIHTGPSFARVVLIVARGHLAFPDKIQLPFKLSQILAPVGKLSPESCALARLQGCGGLQARLMSPVLSILGSDVGVLGDVVKPLVAGLALGKMPGDLVKVPCLGCIHCS